MPRLNELLPPTPGLEPQVPTAAAQPPDPDRGRAAADADGPAESEGGACRLCGGAGYVRRELPLGHADFGRAVPCRCVEEERQDVRRERLQRYSNLGPLTRLTFANLIRRGRVADPHEQARFGRCVDDAEAFASDPFGWLVLVGPSGCGKTHIAAAVANRCLELGKPALFVVVPDLLDHLRAAYGPNAEVGYDQLFEQVRNAPVLILDDLGTHSTTPWAEEKLFQIVNHRFNARLPTVVTANGPLSVFNERLRSRLGDPSLPMPHAAAETVATVHILEGRRAPELQGLNMVELPKVREMTFDSFDLRDVLSERDRKERENAYQQALGYADEPDGWMVLLGGRQRDRTHLLASIANHRRRLGESPFMVQVAGLLDFLRHAMQGESTESFYQVKESVRNCPLLLLDDLEVGMGSEWVRGELYQILNHRHLARLPTVITTPDQLNKLVMDGRWGRLAQLLRDPLSCSEVVVGETPVSELGDPEVGASSATRRQPRRRRPA